MVRIKSFFIIYIFCGLSIHAIAQAYEIRSVNKGSGVIGVEMRVTQSPYPNTDDYITDIVFGLKWQSSYNVNLKSLINTSYHIKKSGNRLLKGNFHYQAFYADSTPFLIPSKWLLNTWVEIMNISNTQNSAADTGTFSICEAGFDITTDPNFGLNLPDHEPIINGSAAGVSLQAGTLEFAANAGQHEIITKWKTINITGNKGFELQRSDNDSTEFYRIAYINNKGSEAVNNYEFIDSKAEYNKDYFYRIRQVDNDGRETFSQIKKARLFAENNFRLSPNPATDFILLTIPYSIDAGKYAIKIMNAKGTAVYQKEELIDTNRSIKIALLKLAAGNYFITVENDGKNVFSQGFVKF